MKDIDTPQVLWTKGMAFYNGDGVQRDYVQAVSLFLRAANLGHARAQYQLGLCYGKGRGIQNDSQKAYEWYYRAAEQGLAEAQRKVGLYYENGWGVEKDASTAVNWYRKAALQGDVSAQYRLGLCYESGMGIEKNLQEALQWYQMAMTQGHSEAKKKADGLLADGNISDSKVAKNMALPNEHDIGVIQEVEKAIDRHQRDDIRSSLEDNEKEPTKREERSILLGKKEHITTYVDANKQDEIPPRQVYGWGPERKTYLLSNPPIKPVFNSYTDNPLLGDERKFLRIAEKKPKAIYKNNLELESGKQYEVYIYYDNNASPSASTEQHNYIGVAEGVKLSAVFPHSLSKGEKATISAKISATNTEPSCIWDVVNITAKEAMTLHYVEASAKIYNKATSAGKVLSINLFCDSGTFIGFDKMDGRIPSTNEAGSGHINFTLQTRAVKT